ncbi:MAG: hypothetical protein R2727_11730 [Bacteroidales bacterium]
MTETAGIFSADLNINDNDELAIVIYEPVIGFTNSASSVNENGVSYDVEVSIEYPMGSDISVDYDVTARNCKLRWNGLYPGFWHINNYERQPFKYFPGCTN